MKQKIFCWNLLFGVFATTAILLFLHISSNSHNTHSKFQHDLHTFGGTIGQDYGLSSEIVDSSIPINHNFRSNSKNHYTYDFHLGVSELLFKKFFILNYKQYWTGYIHNLPIYLRDGQLII